MKSKLNKEKIYLLVIAVLVIIIIILGVLLGNSGKKDKQKGSNNNGNNDQFINIRFNEDISKDGIVEGIDELHFSNVRIDEDDFSRRVDLTLENMSENDIEAQKLKVVLYNKNRKEICAKEIDIGKIEKNKYEFVNLEFEKEKDSDFELVYDVKIFAIGDVQQTEQEQSNEDE